MTDRPRDLDISSPGVDPVPWTGADYDAFVRDLDDARSYGPERASFSLVGEATMNALPVLAQVEPISVIGRREAIRRYAIQKRRFAGTSRRFGRALNRRRWKLGLRPWRFELRVER